MCRVLSLLLFMFTLSACTRMPAEYRQDYRAPAVPTESGKLDFIATATIGSPVIYTDQVTGLSTEIVVESEYFSANGRLCRRFTEQQASSASRFPRLSCDGSNGWVEIPIASFAG